MTTKVEHPTLPRTEALPPLNRRLRIARSVPERVRRRGWLIRRCLLVSDVLAIAIAFALAERFVTDSVVDRGEASPLFYPVAGMVVLVLMTARGLYGRDEFRADHTTTDDLPAIFSSVTIGAFMSLTTLIAAGVAAPKLPIVGWALMLVTLPTFRAAGRIVARRRPEYLQNTIILGGG
jgi:hypothetical protein